VTARQTLALRLAVVPLMALLAYAGAEAAAAPTPDEGFTRAFAIVAGTGLFVAAALVRPSWTITAGLVLSLFSSHWEKMDVPLDLDRMMLGVGVLSLLYREWRHRDGRLQTRPVDWVLFVIALYALVSAGLAGELDVRSSRFGLIDRFGLIPFILFFAAPFAFRTERDRRILLAAIVGIGAYLSVTAVLETTGPEAVIVPHYITDDSVGIHADRARGPFLDGAANGIALFGCGIAAVIAFGRWRDRRWRAFALVVAGLCALGVLLALTRVVWLSALIGAPVAMACARETRRFLVPAAGAAFVVIAVALAAVPGLREKVDDRTNDKQPVYDRRNSNSAALRMIDDRPLFGFGWGTFEEESKPYYRQAEEYPLTLVRDLHNVYLSNAVELGLVGTLLWMAALVYAIGGAIVRRGPPELRWWKIGLVAYAVGLAVSWTSNPADYALPTLLLWLWAGVAWGGREHTAPAT
jgi:O-antigen ligase